jgi:hypothetical protein
MQNPTSPTDAELPTSRQLLRSTLIAVVAAALLLVTVVLPAEYGIDPTGAGRLVGLTQMGQIKQQLSLEAEADRAQSGQADPCGGQRSSLSSASLGAFLIGQAHAAQPAPVQVAASRTDEVSVTLKPNQGIEIKLTMKKGAKVTYAWKVEGGVVNHDTHGERTGSKTAHSYKKGTAVAGDQGVLVAAFDGIHGWFWRNRGSSDVTVKLHVDGEYEDVKRML